MRKLGVTLLTLLFVTAACSQAEDVLVLYGVCPDDRVNAGKSYSLTITEIDEEMVAQTDRESQTDRECGERLTWVTRKIVDSFNGFTDYSATTSSIIFETTDTSSTNSSAELRLECYFDEFADDPDDLGFMRVTIELRRSNGTDGYINFPYEYTDSAVAFKFDNGSVHFLDWDELENNTGARFYMKDPLDTYKLGYLRENNGEVSYLNEEFHYGLKNSDRLAVRMRNHENEETTVTFNVEDYRSEIGPYLSNNCRG